MDENKKTWQDHVNTNKLLSDAGDAFTVFGGMLLGNFAGKQLDKFFTAPTVSGFMGIEMADKTKKIVKPAIITGSGVVMYQVGKGTRKKTLRLLGLGVTVSGLNDFSELTTGKPLLSGDFTLGNIPRTGTDITEDIMEETPEYEVVDTETGNRVKSDTTTINLPELSGGYDLSGDNLKDAFKSTDEFYGTDTDTDDFYAEDTDAGNEEEAVQLSVQ